MSNDPALSLPGGKDLIRFPDQDLWFLHGDRQRAETFRGAALQLKASLDRANTLEAGQCARVRRYDDGTVIEVRKQYNFYHLHITCPPREQGTADKPPQLVPELWSGQFFYVPGCFSRFDCFDPDAYLRNEIPTRLKGSFPADEIYNEGIVGGFLTPAQAGLPAPGTSPDGRISRQYGCLEFHGSSLDDADGGQRLKLGSASLPVAGPFTISCLFRLHEAVEFDYSQTYQTTVLDNGYTVNNVVKPCILFSGDGIAWTAKCPGGIAPLMAYAVPTYFSRHWVRLTYPWNPYNQDFVSSAKPQIGCVELENICPGAPVLATNYDAASPYWDKIASGGLDALTGDVDAVWVLNVTLNNTAPYTAFCRFVVQGRHEKSVGTRVSRSLDDGTVRYAAVFSSSYDAGTEKTTLVLQDWLHKQPMGSEGETAQMRFGMQPFPLNNPYGVVIGFNFQGLCFLNDGTMRLVAGKVSDFESEYSTPPILSDPLALGSWYYAVMTCSKAGVCTLYLVEQGSRTITMQTARQSVQPFSNEDGFGNKEKIAAAAMNWRLTPTDDSPDADATTEWEYACRMDLGLLRFYHRELSAAESQLLTREVFDGVFVADDHEAGQLAGAGYTPITV